MLQNCQEIELLRPWAAAAALHQLVWCASDPELPVLQMGALGVGLGGKWHLVTGTRRRDETRDVVEQGGVLWVPREGLCLTSRVTMN